METCAKNIRNFLSQKQGNLADKIDILSKFEAYDYVEISGCSPAINEFQQKDGQNL